ncbi:stage III sporulation protein AF [Blautia liquoris]|mgnify:CR=1 FL=1|jgi:stage III sporulation protein AF|uniref:Stage III sporulation protein AF n=1 Tax=Blautia liquoris TaxID=2779518 RepID=A0A7M2RL20_9FIRM|nr:stage III sporulation protein AF [Blautia liquoris]QOV20040.1 stage III sporulation protein AF [Blautia liquoris]
MTEAIYDWMKNLVFFFLFMAAILNCLPDNQYRKYVQFFLGLVLLVLLAGPFLKAVNLDIILKDTLSSEVLDEELRSSKNAAYSVEGVQEELLENAYAKEIERQISDMLAEQKIQVDKIQVTLKGEDRLQVEKISLCVSNMQEPLYQKEGDDMNREFTRKLDAVKTKLSQVYEVDATHIDISR